MGPWETAPEEVVEEEIDIFAELGALRPGATAPQPQLNQQMLSQNQSADPLAMFMDDDEEETLVADTMFGLEDEPAGMFGLMSEDAPVHEAVQSVPVTQHTLSNEVITELLEVMGLQLPSASFVPPSSIERQLIIDKTVECVLHMSEHQPFSLKIWH